MTVVGVRVVIAMKPLARSKMRLSDALDAAHRATLSLWMLEAVVRAATDAGAVREIVILGGDDAVRTLGGRLHVRWHCDMAGDLNRALDDFYRASCEAGWPALLYLAGDLPLLRASDVDILVAALEDVDLVLGAGARGGTNALLLRCPLDFAFQLGSASFRRHQAEAAARGLRHRGLHIASIEADIDVPADLDRLRRTDPGRWQDYLRRTQALPGAAGPRECENDRAVPDL